MTYHLVIAFDVDDTLVIPSVANPSGVEVPNYEVIAIYHWFQRQGNHMIVWSGGGKDYAEMWARKLGLEADEIIAKTLGRKDIDIAFDDSMIELAKVNVHVKRIKNHIQRYPENERFSSIPAQKNTKNIKK